ncbi:TonB-dependent receptor [Dyella sp. C11]|uniref:TonB-dependent receptor n=1 Tax=Dyella sp. C11 TaxID=2126991 RepID=UPI000D64FB65|nr:TonB-dependent receptor [Dyella sp. C11]
MVDLAKHRGYGLSRHPLWLACMIASGMLVGVLHAQDASAPQESTQAPKAKAASQDDAKSLGAITVTATKHATAIDKTPIAITAVPAEVVADTGATTINDLVKLTPGVSVQDAGAGQTRISIRGIYAAGEPTTGIYYDETPVAGSVGTTSDAGGHQPELHLFDVDRVEVLRGPQGTLYGASSMGGAIRIISNKPELDQVDGSVEAGYAVTKGGSPSWQTNAMFNLPLIQDKLALRVVADKQDTGGYIDNVVLDKTHVGEQHEGGGRLMLRYQPTDKVTVDASFSTHATNAEPNFWTPYPERWALQPLYPVDLPSKYGSEMSTLVPFRDHTKISNLTLNWDLDWATLTAVTSYQDRKSFYNQDSTPLFQYAKYLVNAMGLSRYYNADQYIPSYLYYPGHTTDWSNELRLSSKSNDTLDWTAGLYEDQRKSGLFSEYTYADAATGGPLSPSEIFFRRHISDDLQQKAAYGEATWHVTQDLNITGGLRYYDYTKDVTGYTDLNFNFPLIGGGLIPPTTVSAGKSGWLKKLNVSYNLAPNVMVYALAADGMRPGGANQLINLPVNLTTYKPDWLWNYELGIKSNWFDRKLYVTADVYQINWHNMQVSAITLDGTSQFITNAGAARMRGLEAEVLYRPIHGMDITANFNVIDAVLTQNQISNTYEEQGVLGQTGDRVPYTPKYTGALAMDYRWPMGDSLGGMARIDANYVGTSYSTFRPTDPARTVMGNYTMVDGRIGLEDGGNRWGAYLYVKNMFNKLAFVSTGLQTYYAPFGEAYTVAPRTIGIDVRYNF